MTTTVKKKSLNRKEYYEICEYIKNYRGLAIDCEIDMTREVFPNIEKQTLKSILQTEMCNRTRSNNWRYEANAAQYLQHFEVKSALSDNPNIILHLSIVEGLSPILLSRCILQEKYQFPHKSELSKIVMSPHLIKESKLAANVAQCICSDSQDGGLQDLRRRLLGEEYEFKLKQFAKEAKITYYDENDLRRMGYDKTPDLKIILPFMYKGTIINWMESKAIFGDVRTHKKYLQVQLTSYVNRFGPGIVIYWFGYHEDTPLIKENSAGVIVLDDFPSSDSIELLHIDNDLTEKDTNVSVES